MWASTQPASWGAPLCHLGLRAETSRSFICQIFTETSEMLGTRDTAVGGTALLGGTSFTSEDPATAPGPPTGGTPGTLAEDNENPSLCPWSVHGVVYRSSPAGEQK